MELGSLKTTEIHEVGSECNIKDPATGEATDFFITIMGADSKEWRKHKKAQQAAMIKARQEDKIESLDYDKMDVDALVDCTIGWRGLVDNGEEVKCSKKSAKELYENAPRVVVQLLSYVGNNANFTKG